MSKHNGLKNVTPIELLKQVNAVLVRSNRHDVYKLPNGRTVTLSRTASCPFVNRKQIADIRRELAR